MNYGNYEDFKALLVNKRITSWNSDKLTLEDGTEITIEMSESDCCASAGGEFSNVVLDAMITDISDPLVEKSDLEYDGVHNTALVTIYHNRNIIAQADLYAEHNGYYYCVGSFVLKDVHYPVVDA